MKNARNTFSRGKNSGKGKVGRDSGKHSVPGFTGQDGSPGNWEARTGYTKENAVGASSKGTSISLPSKTA